MAALTAAVGILGVVHAVAADPPADALARMRARGTLRWGGDMQGGEPFVFQDPQDGRLVGFEVEIADALARRLGLTAEFVQNDWSMLIPSLERGDFDVAMNGLEVTDARRGRVAFSRPYYVFTEMLVVRRGDRGAETLGDLRGRRVGTLEASLAFDLLAAVPGIDVVATRASRSRISISSAAGSTPFSSTTSSPPATACRGGRSRPRGRSARVRTRSRSVPTSRSWRPPSTARWPS